MDHVSVQPSGSIGRNFIPPEYLPSGKDEYYLRNSQLTRSPDQWRNLQTEEVERLVKNGNTSDNWGKVLVTKEFEPGLIRNTDFFGLVRIGRLRDVILEHHERQIPAGICNSTIVACDIGDDVAIDNVSCLAHYIKGANKLKNLTINSSAQEQTQIGEGVELAGIARMSNPASRLRWMSHPVKQPIKSASRFCRSGLALL
jgi:hypothetical protein